MVPRVCAMLLSTTLLLSAAAQNIKCDGNPCTFENYVPGNFSVSLVSLVTGDLKNEAGGIATVNIQGTRTLLLSHAAMFPMSFLPWFLPLAFVSYVVLTLVLTPRLRRHCRSARQF